MSDTALISELDRLHHRATDLRARETQLADAGENDPASDTWKTAAIVAASAECEFHAALVAAWPALSEMLRGMVWNFDMEAAPKDGRIITLSNGGWVQDGWFAIQEGYPEQAGPWPDPHTEPSGDIPDIKHIRIDTRMDRK